jgi:hypothetical protein
MAEKTENEELLERDYSADQRKDMAAKGLALPDGSFPIADVADLKNAIKAFGRAKDKDAAKRHIIKRAKQLGATDLLPDGWLGESAPDDTETESNQPNPDPEQSSSRAEESAVTTSLTVEAVSEEAPTPNTYRFRMLVIRPGLSENRNLWKPEVLREAASRLDGRPIYLDHGSQRSMADKVGWWSDVSYVDPEGIYATANIFRNSAHPWLGPMISEAIKNGQPGMIGVSIDAYVTGTIEQGPDGSLQRVVHRIERFNSADIVAEPGAGGKPVAVVAEGICTDEELEMLEKLTLEELRKARPDLVEALAKPAEEAPVKEEAPKPDTAHAAEDSGVIKEVSSRLEELTRQLALREQQAALEAKLNASRLPDNFKKLVREEVGDRLLEDSAMDAIIAKYVDAYNAVASSAAAAPAGRVVFPLGPANSQITPIEQVVAALEDWFGAPDPEMKGKYHPIDSIRQFYTALTGDRDVNGYYNPKESIIGDYLGMRLAEALPNQPNIIGGSTVTLPNIFGLSMNRALQRMYKGQSRWWEPVVTRTRLSNFKEQQRIIMHQFGSLTNRPVGTEEYTELTYSETQEVFTPTGYGNVVSVGRRAIINDDLDTIRRIPQLLAQSATYTINERVANLFLANSGAGVTLSDGFTWFNAANHQGNAGTAALSKGSLTTAIKTVAAMTNQAGKRIGWQLRYLLIPIDLIDTAYEITASEKVPGSSNNEPNFIRSRWGIPTENVIVVPQFTDTNNWYALADPSEIAIIEVGFVLGREEPEILVQDAENTGTVFTHDTMMFKVRHEYGMGVLDYRGSYGAIVP